VSRRTCADCGKISPETETQYTLIAKFGWRVVRTNDATGQAGIEWRCPTCWAAFKSRQPGAHGGPLKTSRPPPPLDADGAAPTGVDESVEAGKLFDRALQALTTKPPNKPR
jgi:hypothetical protein